MNFYENVVILNPNLSDEELKTATDKISDLITNGGGEIIRIDVWGRKRLAYELNKHKMGYYVLFVFKAPAAVLHKTESYFKVFDPVIKFMAIKLSKKEIAVLQKPAPEAAAVEAEKVS
ncbi:MAG: 30S ribosomal protein S6 [Dissulfurispiraceae bacterium]|jgi:small subunit ribosomal protein S6|nr:30S ribosomal protein S6 [Dissulfurispiraceae bacterium]